MFIPDMFQVPVEIKDDMRFARFSCAAFVFDRTERLDEEVKILPCVVPPVSRKSYCVCPVKGAEALIVPKSVPALSTKSRSGAASPLVRRKSRTSVKPELVRRLMTSVSS